MFKWHGRNDEGVEFSGHALTATECNNQAVEKGSKTCHVSIMTEAEVSDLGAKEFEDHPEPSKVEEILEEQSQFQDLRSLILAWWTTQKAEAIGRGDALVRPDFVEFLGLE